MNNFENNTLDELVVLGEALDLFLDEVMNKPSQFVVGTRDKVRAVQDDVARAFRKTAELRIRDDS